MKRREPLNVYLGREVKRAVRASGRSQAVLAQQIGMPVISLSRRLTGTVGFYPSDLARIAAELGDRGLMVEWVTTAECRARLGVEHKVPA